MFEQMRRQDRALALEEAKTLLRNGEFGILSVSGRNGYPHPVPMSYVYADDEIWLHCAREGSKLEDIRADSRVAFCVVGPTQVLPAKFSTNYSSVIVYGEAQEVPPDQAERCLTALLEKYSPEHLEAGKAYIQRATAKTAVLRIVIRHMTGKARS